MDTVDCRHHWLLWTVLIILLSQCWKVSGQSHGCPQGLLRHDMYTNGRNYITCCYPTKCGVGEEVKPCMANGTYDTCQLCSTYRNQSLRTSSFTMDECEYWPLDKECRSVDNPSKRNINDERTRRCMCNIEQGKKFIRPEFDSAGAPVDSYCQRRHNVCRAGEEPIVDGDCRPCKANYFKSAEGFKLCEPKINCSMLGLKFVFRSDATADNKCSEPDPVTTPKQHVPETSYPVTPSQPLPPVVSSQTTTTAPTSTQDVGHYAPSREKGSDDKDVTWPIVGVALFLLLLVCFISLVMFWRKRNGKPLWVCASTKNYGDPEKTMSHGSSTSQDGHRNKHNGGEGCFIPQHLTDVDKIINNNFNGGVPCGMGYLSNGLSNGNVRHAHFNQTEHGDARPYYGNQVQYIVPTTRQSILKNGNHNVVYEQSRGNVRDRSIDSIGQEKLRVHVDESEANQDLGESDPLLVADHLRGAAPCQIQNLGASVGNSPPVMQAGVNPIHLLPCNGNVMRTNFCPAFVPSGTSPPAQAPVVTYAPATGAVTFTRSTSVIASPEGEVDEDEIEARLPRLSQLLTENESCPVAESHQDDRDFFRADSPGRETTQQLRAPSQRLIKDQYQPQRNGTPTNQQPRRQGNNQTQQRPGFPPAVVGPVLQRGPLQHQPDHHIMNLKEQQFAESFHSSPNTPPTPGQQKGSLDQSATDTVGSGSEEAQQTELKTQLSPAIVSDFSTGAIAHVKDPKTGSDITQTTEPKLVETGRDNPDMTNRKRQVSGASNGQSFLERKDVPGVTNFQSVADRKRVPSGDSNSSSQGTLERQRAPSGDQRPCIKTYSPEESDNNTKKHDHYNRIVSFEEVESPDPANRQRGPTSDPKMSVKSSNSTDKVVTDSRFRGPLRSISDPEQKSSPQIESEDEETERKCVSLEYDASCGFSKAAVNSDVSGTDSNSSSPCRTQYRRSQSVNASSSSDSAHKPPPRSMSEEKPQKLDRPIAKVKPMPASDNAVNQLPFEVSEEANVAHQVPVPAAAFLGQNTDDSDHEDNPVGNHFTSSALDEDEDENKDEVDEEL